MKTAEAQLVPGLSVSDALDPANSAWAQGLGAQWRVLLHVCTDLLVQHDRSSTQKHGGPLQGWIMRYRWTHERNTTMREPGLVAHRFGRS